MKKYEVLAFDLDDTLIDNLKSMKYAFSAVCHFLGILYNNDISEQWLHFDNEFWCDWQNGNIKIPDDTKNWVEYIRSLRFYRFFAYLSIDFKTAIHLNTLYCDNLEGCIEPIEGARKTLEKLQNSYKLMIATNGVKNLVTKKLEVIGASAFFSGIICSEDIGANKPHALFFENLIAKCNCNKDKILLIGDSLTSDILGGMNNGIDTVWFNPTHKPLPNEYSPTFEISELLELTRKLSR